MYHGYADSGISSAVRHANNITENVADYNRNAEMPGQFSQLDIEYKIRMYFR